MKLVIQFIILATVTISVIIDPDSSLSVVIAVV